MGNPENESLTHDYLLFEYLANLTPMTTFIETLKWATLKMNH